jgi:hypothetical protein
MPRADGNALAQQLANLGHVRRFEDDRVIRFCLHGTRNLPRLTNKGSAQIIARMVVQSDRKKVYAVVVADRGLLSTLEFDKAPGVLASGDMFRVTSIKGPRT